MGSIIYQLVQDFAGPQYGSAGMFQNWMISEYISHSNPIRIHIEFPDDPGLILTFQDFHPRFSWFQVQKIMVGMIIFLIQLEFFTRRFIVFFFFVFQDVNNILLHGIWMELLFPVTSSSTIVMQHIYIYLYIYMESKQLSYGYQWENHSVLLGWFHWLITGKGPIVMECIWDSYPNWSMSLSSSHSYWKLWQHRSNFRKTSHRGFLK